MFKFISFLRIPAKQLALTGLLLACLSPLLSGKVQAASMVVDSFDGPITQNEINSFKSYIQTVQPVVWPNTDRLQTEYAQGKTGEAIKAMGLMYELTGDTAILDRMIYFSDVVLSQRNDILPAPYGQRTVWTNTIAPVWPGNTTGIASADSGNGDPVGHLANSARLILQTPSIWDTTVPDGDPYGHGVTYKQRASKFLAEADYVVNEFLLGHLLDLSKGNKYYFSSESPYMANGHLPWNQQMMISYALQNMAIAHELLGDNPSLVSQYDAIVQANMDWFFKNDSTKRTYTTSAGNIAYYWGYNPSLSTREDNSHGSLDVAGFYRAYLSGRYGITAEMLKPFANTYVDVMMRGPYDFAGKVDGTDGSGNSAPTTYVRSGYLFLTDLRPDKYYDLANADLSRASTGLDIFSKLMWAKNERYKEGYSIRFSPAPSPSVTAQTVTLSTLLNGASIRYTTDGSTPTPTTGTLYTEPFKVSNTTTVKAIAYTADTASPVSIGKYTIAPTAPRNVTAAAVSSSQINLSWTAADAGGGVLSYDVYRGADRIGSTSATTYSDTGLSASTAYSYKVIAKDAAGNESGPSNAASATTFSDSALGIDQMSYTVNSGDLIIHLYLNGDTLASIRDNAGALAEGTDFINNGASVKLNKSYLSHLAVGKYALTFTFGSGKHETLTLNVVQGSLTLNKTYFTSSIWSSSFDAKNAFDANAGTRWSSAKGQVSDQYLGVNFGSKLEFNKVVLKEISYPRVNSFVLQISDDGVNYNDIPGTEGTSIGALQTVTFDTVSARYLRLWMYSTKLESGASKEPSINEFEVYNEIDTTPPDVTAPADMTVEATGERTLVSIGSATSPDDVTITNDAPKEFPLGTTVVTWTATNANGISSTAVQRITVVDTTAPVIKGVLTPPSNTNGWHKEDVSVHFAVYDSGSGIASVSPDILISTEGKDQTAEGTAVDQAGNQATTTVTHIHIDKTKPVTHAALTPSVADGANGWYLHPVTVQLTGEDALSGVDTIEYSLDGTAWRKYTGPVTIAQDGRFTVSYRSTDKAGNQEQPQTVSFNLDTTGPVVSISVPAAGSSYPVSGDLVPDYTTSDSLSGLDSSKTTIALNGSPLEKGVVVPIYTLPLGANTVQVTARDMAGNVRSATVSFATYADLDSLKALVTRFEDAKEIDNRGVANSLQSKLKQGNLQAFIQEVKAQSGKHITSEAAAYLQKIAQALPLDTMVPVTTFQYTPLKDAKENYISGLPVILSEIDSELWVLNGKY